MNLHLSSSSERLQPRQPGPIHPVARACGWLLVAALAGAQAVGARAQADDEPPAGLSTNHADLRIRYLPDAEVPLALVISDDDVQPRQDYEATNVVLLVNEAARLELPGDFPPLGLAGDPLWVLPASQQPGVLYLGLTTDDRLQGAFSGPIDLRLLQVSGPGDFFLWQADLGELRFWMNSSDGLDVEDAYPQASGGHSHLNWGFSTNGVYHLTLQASGRRAGESTNTLSLPTTFTFHVLPLPASTPFQQWQDLTWPGNPDPSVRGPEANPDGDRWPNLWEYAHGTDPRVIDEPAITPIPEIRLVSGPEATHIALRLRLRSAATDIEVGVEASDDALGPWTSRTMSRETVSLGDGFSLLTLTDPSPLTTDGRAFYRVSIQLSRATP